MRPAQSKLLVVTSHFGGETQITPYYEFLNKPYIRMVKTRSLNNHPPNLVADSLEFVKEIKEDKQKYNKFEDDDLNPVNIFNYQEAYEKFT